MKASLTIKTPNDYLRSLTEPRRKILATLHKAICLTAPRLKPHIKYGMLGYGNYHDKYASGREGDWFIVGLASQKNYISLYICACDKDGYLAERNKDRLGNISVGKSCIRFKKLEDLNLKVTLELVKKASKLARGSASFGP